MSEFQSSPEFSTGPGIAELQDEVQSLRALVSAFLVVLIVFGFSIDLYLWKHVSVVRKESAQLNAASSNFDSAKAIDYWNHLVQYSRSHPEFVPVISKYNMILNETLIGNPNVKQ